MDADIQDRPLVTIFTLVYNTGQQVIAALNAIKVQLYQPIEHIIIDDCSTDNSVAIIKDWIRENKYECTFIQHEQNKGICYSINEAIKTGRGKYIFGISDDIIMPDKLTNDVSLMESNPEFGLVHSRSIVRYMDTGEEIPLYFKNNESNSPFEDFIKGKLSISSVTVTYRREIFDRIGYFDESNFIEDFDMFLRILYYYKVGYIKRFSVIYCRHPKAISNTHADRIASDMFKTLLKWKHLPKYKWYVLYRKQLALYNAASTNKKQALKYLLPSLILFWRRILYASLVRLLFSLK